MTGGAAAIDGRISVGDRLVAIKNIADSGEDFYLDNCTQDDAIHALKRCKNKVILLIARAADSSFEEEVEVWRKNFKKTLILAFEANIYTVRYLVKFCSEMWFHEFFARAADSSFEEEVEVWRNNFSINIIILDSIF